MKYRDVFKLLADDGWKLARQNGSHRQFQHPAKSGTVTLSPHSMSDEVPPGTLNSILKQAGLK